MFVPALPPRPVRLIAADGTVTRYPMLIAFVDAVGLHWIRHSIGERFRTCQCASLCRSALFCPTAQVYPFILRDEMGEPLTVEHCTEAWCRERCAAAPLRGWLYRNWNGEGPVPYTGKRRGGRYFRRIRTFTEHRAAAGVVCEEGEPVFRAARNRHNLPTPWDDRPVSARKVRSWKRHRARQWKARK